MTTICNRRTARAAITAAAVLGLLSSTLAEPHAQKGSGIDARSHDLNLPRWGPYSNAYLGVSHIPDLASGMRFDITLFAGPHTTSTPDVPNASLNTGFVAWEAAPDLSYHSYRQKLEGQQVYAEIAFAALDLASDARLIRVDLVNGGTRAKTMTLNLLASMQRPNRAPGSVLTPRRILRASIPAGGKWVSGVHYRAHRRARPTPSERLVYDGWLRGEVREDGLVDGRALRMAAGDTATYAVPAGTEVAVLRYRAKTQVALADAGGVSLPPAPDGGTWTMPLAVGTRALTLRPAGAVDLEGIAFVPASSASAVSFPPEDADTRPEMAKGPAEQSLLLKYRQADAWYGLRWFRPGVRIREFRNGTLDFFFARRSHSKTLTVAQGDGRGHYANLLFGGTPVAAGGRETIWALVSTGSREAVERTLDAHPDTAALERAWARGKARAAIADPLPAGRRFMLARQLIGANLLMNIVYPVYTQDQYIRHFTPGKWWDSLYTWDSGFIGIGMADVAPRLSADVLRAYTTPPGAQSAFIHHGTPLPVQHHQYLELWNRTQDRRMLADNYPRLRHYYDFLLGRVEGSTIAALPSGLLKSWDYFYNSGGWDDLPPQVRVHAAKLQARAAPMVTTAHAIRAGKTLRMAALELGRTRDVAQYDADIARLTRAVQANAWDPATGYFGYVIHDAAGRPEGLLRTPDGENWNRTLDGVQPLIAGITTPEQTRAILANLRDPAKLLTPVGLTAVDRSASYYRPDGYWNGTVWFPHQWFVWKALLDQGAGGFAWQIARTALDAYQTEADASWSSAEHFEVATGQGTGWHQFSGLSSPIANWFQAYFVPGRLSTGYDIWVRSQTTRPDKRGITADLAIHSARNDGFISVLATLAPGERYRATWNNRSIEAIAIHDGAYELRIPLSGSRKGRLDISASNVRPTVQEWPPTYPD